jgi:ribosomal protein L19E
MAIEHNTTNQEIEEMVKKCFRKGGLFKSKKEMRRSFRQLRDALKSLEDAKKISPEIWHMRFGCST